MRIGSVILGVGIATAGAVGLGALGVGGCSGDAPTTDEASPSETEEPTAKLEGPAPALLISQAWFERKDGKPVPQPAKLLILRTDGTSWHEEIVLDPDSNVFHKAMWWRDGILTIGGTKATVKHWTASDSGWQAKTLWAQSWGGKFDRMRDIEIGDVDGDGEDELVIATHDQGVVAVGDEQDDGSWTFAEMDQKADTFVHEIELGDVDGDGTKEFYATPSERNRASGESQPGSVARYDYKDGAYVRTAVVDWTESHAKEILVADLDGDGVDSLLAVREAHTEKKGDKVEIVDPVRIERFDRAEDGSWTPTVVATLEDRQCRFLVPGDINGDGKLDLIAAGMKSGLWLLAGNEAGTFDNMQIDANSGGFEHATHVADLDGDGKLEVYVAADTQKEIRRYVWDGGSFKRDVLQPIGKDHITWNIQDGTL